MSFDQFVPGAVWNIQNILSRRFSGVSHESPRAASKQSFRLTRFLRSSFNVLLLGPTRTPADRYIPHFTGRWSPHIIYSICFYGCAQDGLLETNCSNSICLIYCVTSDMCVIHSDLYAHVFIIVSLMENTH